MRTSDMIVTLTSLHAVSLSAEWKQIFKNIQFLLFLQNVKQPGSQAKCVFNFPIHSGN